MFRVTGECGVARCGLLGTSGGSIPTPAMLISASHGDTHTLTPDSMERLGPVGLMINPIDFIDCPRLEAVVQNSSDVRKFWALSSPCVVSIPRDPTAFEYGVKPSSDQGAHVMAHTGGKLMLNSVFLSINEALRPDILMSLCDDIPANSSKRRIALSVKRTFKWLDDCLEHAKTKDMNSKVWGSITGASSVEQRERSAKQAASREVDGFVLCGFGTGEAFEERPSLWKTIMDELPPEKPRAIVGMGNPDEILAAVGAGIDFFDGAYVINTSRAGYALTFPLDFEDSAAWSSLNAELELGEDDTKINMLSLKHRLDSSPVLKGCECYCCQRHSRAYIHHLIQTHEMLGSVLLHMHNTHHMLKFFESVRSSIHNGVFSEHVEKLASRRANFLAKRS
ncbi:hypothetical protein BSKO_06182 [Bryopsis sp. KO-2023]|nr:hypothetical protein BSKO_06182 [Bryopsis sp. KO-2023]